MTIRINSLNLGYIKANREGNQYISTIEIFIIREIVSIDIGQIVEIGEHQADVEVSMDKIIEEDCIMSLIIEMTIGETILEMCKITEVKISEIDADRITQNDNFGRGRRRSRDRHYSDNIKRNDRSSSRSRSGSRVSDHFTQDYPTLQVEKEADQIQQMYNSGEEQTALKILTTDTYNCLNKINLVDEAIVDHLTL